MDLCVCHSDLIWHPVAVRVGVGVRVSWEVVDAIVGPVAVVVVVGVRTDAVAVQVVPLRFIGRERVVIVGEAVVVVVVINGTSVVGRGVQAHCGAVPIDQHDLACCGLDLRPGVAEAVRVGRVARTWRVRRHGSGRQRDVHRTLACVVV